MEKFLPKKWQDFLAAKPETGMGYQVVKITLSNGKVFDGVIIIQSSLIESVPGGGVEVDIDLIANIELTHRKR